MCYCRTLYSSSHLSQEGAVLEHIPFVLSQPKVAFAVFPPSRSREREIRRPSTFFYWVLTVCQSSTVRYAHRYIKGKQSEKLLL